MTLPERPTETQDRSESRPFGFLDKSLNLLVVEDNDLAYGLTEDLFAPIGLYSLFRGCTTGEALSHLKSGLRFHVCVLDLGMTDVDNDEFHLLRQYSTHCSIVVLTGSRSAQKGASSIQLGARAVFEKGGEFDGCAFTREINRLALLSIVNCRFSENGGDTLSFATKVLFEKSPPSVTEWAEYLRITDRQLRNLWAQGSGFGAKYVLHVFNLYRMAFQYYENLLFGSPEIRKRPIPDLSAYRKLASYHRTHQEIVSFMVS